MAKKKSDRFTLRTWVSESMGFRDQEASAKGNRRRAGSLSAPAAASTERDSEESDFQPTCCGASGTDTLPPYTTHGINAFPAAKGSGDRVNRDDRHEVIVARALQGETSPAVTDGNTSLPPRGTVPGNGLLPIGTVPGGLPPADRTDPRDDPKPVRALQENAMPDALANGSVKTGNGMPPSSDAPMAVSDKKARKAAKKAAKLKALKEEWAREAGVAAPPAPLGTAKGVETMFRNAFRTEMELLALAATKANIMISLNGFIVSALMVSGAFIFSSSPEFLVPAGIFMLTAAASIVCALLSASPERVGRFQETWRWLKDVFRRKARLRDFKARVSHNPTVHFFGDSPNILIYEDRAKIPKDRYWQMMQDIMNDREQIYFRMSEELYWLGLMADKQFKFLHMSYVVFRWGLLASVIAFTAVKTLPSVIPAMQAQKQAAHLQTLGINVFRSLYEPSAVQQLPDGRILVVEDEPTRAASILTIEPDGSLREDEALDTRIIRDFRRKLNDLEALTRDPEGYIYAITSHSPNRNGQRRPDREHFLRFRIQGTDIQQLESYSGLIDDLKNSSELKELIKARTGTELDFRNTNIEGLAFDPHKNRLMLGFRDPEFNELALVVSIDNPKDMFEKHIPPHFVSVAFLDIKGGGIRSLNYDPVLKSFILANEVKDDDGTKFSQLWTWSGNPNDAPKAIPLPNLRYLSNVEAVDSVVINGQHRLLLMGDEGDAKKNLPAKYMVVDYADL